MFGNSLKKGFGSVYYIKVHCPVCKEDIYANALVCPFCKTDFTKPPYNSRTIWQRNAMYIVFIIAFIVSISICLNGAPIISGIFICLILYVIGYLIVQKIQSLKNYHHK